MTTAREQIQEAVRRTSPGYYAWDMALGPSSEEVADAASDVWERRVDDAVLRAIEKTPKLGDMLVRLRNEIVEGTR